MNRPKRVLSFPTKLPWSGHHRNGSTNTSTPPDSPTAPHQLSQNHSPTHNKAETLVNVYDQPKNGSDPSSPVTPASPRPRGQSDSKPPSRRNSLALGYQPPIMDITSDTPAELQPIFTYLNSHSNKLYQEGYFLKLHDLDSRGRPSADRVWNECFAQLVGTVLSLWDAAQLDAAGEDGEVIPTFINLTDASIKMIESLPMNGVDGQSLQNVLSISTAANNRYLLHFNSLHSLTQWTAGIRLAMFEHATLQESYTGSILAGKGKQLNGIKEIMERTRFPTEDWARVRFGAGTPWRRCWCVITPPDEKAFAKAQKNMKKKSAYDRSVPVVKGDIKFYESRKVTKKSRPIATISDAFSAYAIYPQSKPLIDQSTLIKVEGMITIHSSKETTTEGFIFVMPEVHPAVSGFEMMLRWLIPCFDTFALYGRPVKLIADVLDTRSLMFAMPTHRRYGYLELIDVAGLIHTDGSQNWSEREWRKQMRILTSKRVTSAPSQVARAGTDLSHRRGGSRSSLNLGNSRSSLNLPSSRAGLNFADDGPAAHSTPGSRRESPAQGGDPFASPNRTDSARPGSGNGGSPHRRVASDRINRRPEPSRLSLETSQNEGAPAPPPHVNVSGPPNGDHGPPREPWRNDRLAAEHEHQAYGNGQAPPSPRIENFQPHSRQPMRPVQQPPQMAHRGGQRPPVQPALMPDLRRANSAMDAATLAQLHEANRAGNRPVDDSGVNYRQPPPHMGPPPHGNPNYGPGGPGPGPGPGPGYGYGPPGGQMNNHYGPGGRPPMGPGGGMRDGRGPPGGPGAGGHGPGPGRLPTIPGTPAVEPQQFDLPVQGGRPPTHQRELSAGSTKRKPLPERGASNGWAGR